MSDEQIKRWREEDGIIYFIVTSDGTSGEAWIKRLEEKGFRVSEYAKNILYSKYFKPTNGVIYEIAVLKGLHFDDNSRITSSIRKKASEMKRTTPNAEASCLIRENFTDKDLEAMDLKYIVVMHEPIKVSGGYPVLLTVDRVNGGRWLSACQDIPGYKWLREHGFAFVRSLVS